MTLAVGGAGATGLLVPWCSANDCCEEGSCVPRKPPKTPNNTSATHDEMSNLQARRALYGRPCPNHDLSRLCVVRDARGSAVAALTWVLWKGRNRLQTLEATSRKCSGPTSFKYSGNIWRNACVKVPSIWNFEFVLEKIGSFKTGLSRFGINFPLSK